MRAVVPAAMMHGPILVGVEGSKFSRVALRWAIAEGGRSHSPVVAVLVWRVGPLGRASPRGGSAAAHEPPEVRFQRLLDEIVGEVTAETGGPAPVTRAVPGVPAHVLVDASDEARMLVLGSHGHGRLFDAVLGSVAEYCIRNAVCPVTVVPALLAEGDDAPDRSLPATEAPL